MSKYVVHVIEARKPTIIRIDHSGQHRWIFACHICGHVSRETYESGSHHVADTHLRVFHGWDT